MTHHLKFFLISGEVSPGGALAPVLAPFNLDLPRVARQINERSLRRFPKGFPIAVQFTVSGNGLYEIDIRPPSLRRSLDYLVRHSPPDLTDLDLYNLVLFRAHCGRKSTPLWSWAVTLLAELSSFGPKEFSKIVILPKD